MAASLDRFFFYLPWILLFIEMYRNHKSQIKTMAVVKLFDKMNDDLIEIVERYHKRYGDLPEEEPESESQDALQNE